MGVSGFEDQSRKENVDKQLEQKKELLPQNGDSISMFGGEEQKPQIYTQNDASKHETQSKTEMTMTNSYNLYNYEQTTKNVFFVTEKLNLPREQVVTPNSNNSSPSYGFKHKFSPATPEGKVRNDALVGSFYDQNKIQSSS